MSYQIYYKWKVFKDDKNNLFVFSLDGSNNCCVINHYTGRQLRERDWHLFFSGTEEGLKSYLHKIDKYHDGFATSKWKGLKKEQLIDKIVKLSKKAEDIKNLKQFFYLNCFKHEYKGVDLPLSVEELYDFSEENYFAHNSKKEYLRLGDKTSEDLRRRGY